MQIDAGSKNVTIGPRKSLLRKGLVASRFNWQIDPPASSFRCLAQIRARHEAAPATVEFSGSEPSSVRVWFDEAQAAVAPGQAVVLYDEDRLLGGGWIDRSINPTSAEADSDPGEHERTRELAARLAKPALCDLDS